MRAADCAKPRPMYPLAMLVRSPPAVRHALISGVLGWLTGMSQGCANDVGATEVTVSEFRCRNETARALTTAPWPNQARSTEECPWLSFPAQALVRVLHGMSAPPVAVLPYIAFEPDGVGGTLAVGDLLTINLVDDQEVVVRNNTNQRFYLRLVLLKE